MTIEDAIHPTSAVMLIAYIYSTLAKVQCDPELLILGLLPISSVLVEGLPVVLDKHV